MAKNISEGGATVHQLNPKKRNAGSKTAAAKAAADKANAMLGGPSVAEAQAKAGPAPEIVDHDPVGVGDAQTAPSFGSNEPTVGVFLTHVNILVAHDAAGDELKLQLKEHRKKRKTLRLGAQEAGIVMGELDRAVTDSQTELVDLQAKLDRYLTYMDWLGHGLERQSSAPGVPKATDTERDAMRWFKRGDADGRMGKSREVPEGCPSIHVQDYLRGHEHGQGLLMQGSPLTAGAFNADGSLKTAAELKPAVQDDGKFVTFTEAHFQAGTDLDDANLKTLLRGHKEAFHNAENVVAIFGDKKRVLKELDPTAPGGFYIDDGSDEAEITAPEPVAPSAAEFS